MNSLIYFAEFLLGNSLNKGMKEDGGVETPTLATSLLLRSQGLAFTALMHWPWFLKPNFL